jgi:hypothetical protein
MKNTTVKIVAGSVFTCALLGWVYYDQFLNKQALSEQVKPREHGVGVMQLSCSDEEMSQLEFSVNNVKTWTKNHQDLLSMESAMPSLDRRFKGTNVLPVAALISEHKDIQTIEVIPCDAENALLSPTEITKHPNEYVLGLSRGGRMKLLRPARNVRAINLKR